MNSAWTIEFEPQARKQLGKLDRLAAQRIVDTIEQGLVRTGDPRAFGEAMVGNWAGFWRYRVGNYRAIVRIEDGRLIVLIVQVAHRREVYR